MPGTPGAKPSRGTGVVAMRSKLRERPKGGGFWLWPLRPLARRVLSRQMRRCGRGTSFDGVTSTFSGIANISLGDDVFIGPRCFIAVPDAALSIGDDTVIGPDLCVMGGDHRMGDPGTLYRDTHELGVNEPVAIGCNVWIGARVTVLKGVRIGDGAIVGAGSVVNQDIPSQAIAVGVPARVVRWRFEAAGQDRHAQRMAPLWGHVDVSHEPAPRRCA